MNVGQPHVAAAESERGAGMVDAQAMEHRGMKIVDLALVFDRAVSPFIGCAIDRAPLDTTARHPHGERERVVIATIGSLGERRSTELSSPDHEGRIEESSLLKIFEQCGDGLVDGQGVFGVPLFEIAVLIPAIMTDTRAGQFDEPHAAFHEPASHQAFLTEDACRFEGMIESIHAARGLGFLRHVADFGNRGLHPKREFIVRDGRFDGILPTVGLECLAIQASEEVEFFALQIERGLERPDVGKTLLLGLEDGTLVGRGEESIAEAIESAGWDQASVENDEAGEILALASQTVGDPGSHARPSLQGMSGVEKIVGRSVLGKLGGHRADDRELVGVPSDLREQAADFDPALTVLGKLPRGPHHRPIVVELSGSYLKELGGIATMILREQRLGIEGIDLGHSAIHVEEDDAAGLGSKMRRGARIGSERAAALLVGEQRHQRDGPEAVRRLR